MGISMNQKQCAKVLKALADDTRLKILEFLFKGEYSVSEIACSTDIDYSHVSHHLGVLRNAGIVLDNKDGKFVMYKLHPDFRSEKTNALDFSCCSIEFSGVNLVGDIRNKL
jgi:ArsR family transcriptional regulator